MKIEPVWNPGLRDPPHLLLLMLVDLLEVFLVLLVAREQVGQPGKARRAGF